MVTYRDETAAPALSAGRAALDSMAKWDAAENRRDRALLAVAPVDHGGVLASGQLIGNREVEVNCTQAPARNWRERFAEVGSTALPLPLRGPAAAGAHSPGSWRLAGNIVTKWAAARRGLEGEKPPAD